MKKPTEIWVEHVQRIETFVPRTFFFHIVGPISDFREEEILKAVGRLKMRNPERRHLALLVRATEAEHRAATLAHRTPNSAALAEAIAKAESYWEALLAEATLGQVEPLAHRLINELWRYPKHKKEKVFGRKKPSPQTKMNL